EPVLRIGGAEGERARKRLRLRRRDALDRRQRRTHQLGEARERNLRLRLDPACAQDPHSGRLPDGVLEQRGLADPGLAHERERPAAACARLVEEAVEREPLFLAAEQHGAILTRGDPPDANRVHPRPDQVPPGTRPPPVPAYRRRTSTERRHGTWQSSKSPP